MKRIYKKILLFNLLLCTIFSTLLIVNPTIKAETTTTTPTDLTGYTVSVPAGWSASENYGIFVINYTEDSFDPEMARSFNYFYIGYDKGLGSVYEPVNDSVLFSNEENFISILRIAFDNSTQLVLKNINGTDATNQDLIEWFVNNNATFTNNNPSNSITFNALNDFEDYSANLQYSFDAGETWQNMGDIGFPTTFNNYNSVRIRNNDTSLSFTISNGTEILRTLAPSEIFSYVIESNDNLYFDIYTPPQVGYTITLATEQANVNTNIDKFYYSLDNGINWIQFTTLPLVINNVEQIMFKNESEYNLNFNYIDSEIGDLELSPNDSSINMSIVEDFTFNFYLTAYDSTPDDLEKVNADLVSLILGGDIISNVSLPKVGENGSTFSYEIESGMLDYVSINNSISEIVIRRPSINQPNANFVLRVYAEYGKASNYKDFEYTILAYTTSEFIKLPAWYYFNNQPDFLASNSIYMKDFDFIMQNEIYNYISSVSRKDETNNANDFYLVYQYYDDLKHEYTITLNVATYTYNASTNEFENFTWLNNNYRQIYLGTSKLVSQAEYNWFNSNGVFEYLEEISNSEFADIFFALVDSQVYYIKSLLSYELFGINLFSAFTSILTLSLVVLLIKKLL